MIVKRGILIKNKHSNPKEVDYRVEILKSDRLNDVLKLNKLVYDLLPNKEILSLDTFQGMYDDLKKGAILLGALDNDDNIFAYRHAIFPGLNERNLAYDLNFPIDFHKVCQLETTIVHPDYRGNRLQSKFVGLIIDLVKDRGYTDLACTISPYNYPSLNNLMKNGLKVRALKEKYNDLLRFVLHGKIGGYDYGNPIDTVNTPIKDIEKQKDLLEKGYIGYKLHKDESLDYVKFK